MKGSLLPAALLSMPVFTEQRKLQVGAVWQPQRHAACGHLLAGAAGGSSGGRRAVERPKHAAQAAQTPRGSQPPKGSPKGRCGGDHACACRGGRRKEGRLREDAGWPLNQQFLYVEHVHGRVHGQRSRLLGTLRGHGLLRVHVVPQQSLLISAGGRRPLCG